MAYERPVTIDDAGGNLADYGRLQFKQRVLGEAVSPLLGTSLFLEGDAQPDEEAVEVAASFAENDEADGVLAVAEETLAIRALAHSA